MPNPVLAVFGERIRLARKARGWTQADLGDRAGVRAASVYTYEKARNEAGVLSALAIADALGMTLDDLLAEPGRDGGGAR